MIAILKETISLENIDGAQFRAAVKAMGKMTGGELVRLGLTGDEAEKAQAFYFDAKDALDRED